MRIKSTILVAAAASLSLLASVGVVTAGADPGSGDLDPQKAKTAAVHIADKVDKDTPPDTPTPSRSKNGQAADVSVSLPQDVASPVKVASSGATFPMTLPEIGARRATVSSDGVIVRDGAKTDLVLRHSRNRVQALTVLANPSAPTAYRYCFPGSGLAELSGGQVALFHVRKTSDSTLAIPLQGVIGKAWAVDAAGRRLSTNYTLDGNCLVQTVDTQGAVFPVVADPSVSFVKWWPPTWEITLNPKDQRIILSAGGAAVGAGIGAIMCSEGTPVAMAVCAAAGAAVVTVLTEAFKEYGVKEGCNWKAQVQIPPVKVTKKWRSGQC